MSTFEQNACAFLKEVVKANKMMQRIQQASEGIKGNISAQVYTNNTTNTLYPCLRMPRSFKSLFKRFGTYFETDEKGMVGALVFMLRKIHKSIIGLRLSGLFWDGFCTKFPFYETLQNFGMIGFQGGFLI